MCHKCEICRAVVPHGRPMRRHVVYRPNGQIARELPVCQGCIERLESGTRLDILIGIHRQLECNRRSGAVATPPPSVPQAVKPTFSQRALERLKVNSN